MNDRLSVIVPIYNAGNKLTRCIESILSQSYLNLEVILVDDGSNDGSSNLCDELSRRDKRIKIFHQKNQGVSVARNNGLNNATGDYIMFVDADDYLDKKICEVLYNFINKNKCDIAIVNKVFHMGEKTITNVLYNQKELIRSNEEKDLFLLDLFSNYYDDKMNDIQYLSCGVTAKLFKTNLIKKNNITFLENCHYGEDVIFNLNAFENAEKIGYKDYDGYHFVINSTSSTHRFREDWDVSHKKFIASLECFIINNHKDKRFLESLNMMKATRISGLAASYYFHVDNTKVFLNSYIEFKKFLKEPEYKEALKSVNYKLLTKKQKIVTMLIKNHLIFIVALISYIKNLRESCKNEKTN